MSIIINALSTVFSGSTLASAAWNTLSTPAQVAAGVLGVGVAAHTTKSLVTGTIYVGKNLRHGGADVELPDGSRGTVAEVGFGEAKVLRPDGTLVTLRGEELLAMYAQKAPRNWEASQEASKALDELEAQTTGTRAYTVLVDQDGMVGHLGEEVRRAYRRVDGLHADLGSVERQHRELSAAFAEAKVQLDAQNERFAALELALGTPAETAVMTDAVADEVKAAVAAAPTPEAALVAAEAVLAEAVAETAQPGRSRKNRQEAKATPAPATEASPKGEVSEMGKPAAEAAAS
jgi:hypothetical protein